MGVLAISEANLNTLENNLNVLSDNINSVTTDIININGQISGFNNQVEEVMNNVKSLETEIRDFMAEIRGTTIVSNAQNEILIKENELNKKYGHYDEVRRKVSGLINTMDLSGVDKESVVSDTNMALLSAPNYYLSYALIALSSWFKNEREASYSALNKALSLNDSKTSLLMSLVHLKLNRKETAYKWMKRYLSIQNPSKMNSEIVSILDSLSNNVYDLSITTELLNSINNYLKQLNNSEEIKNEQIKRWNNFFSSNIEEVYEREYPYIVKYTNNWENIKNTLGKSYTYNKAYNDFKSCIENSKYDKNKKIEDLLSGLLSNYEKDELDIRKSILKNKFIVENKGNTKEASVKYKNSEFSLMEEDNLFNHLTNIILERNDVSVDTKKLAASYLKEYIISSINETLDNNDLGTTTIYIDDWSSSTINGSNEKELVSDLSNYIKEKYKSTLNKESYLNIKTLISGIGVILGFVLAFFSFAFGLSALVISSVFLIFFLYEVTKKKNEIINICNKEIEDKVFVLNNVLGEVVDSYYINNRNNKNKQNLINYINSFNVENYITNRNN